MGHFKYLTGQFNHTMFVVISGGVTSTGGVASGDESHGMPSDTGSGVKGIPVIGSGLSPVDHRHFLSSSGASLRDAGAFSHKRVLCYVHGCKAIDVLFNPIAIGD